MFNFGYFFIRFILHYLDSYVICTICLIHRLWRFLIHFSAWTLSKNVLKNEFVIHHISVLNTTKKLKCCTWEINIATWKIILLGNVVSHRSPRLDHNTFDFLHPTHLIPNILKNWIKDKTINQISFYLLF